VSAPDSRAGGGAPAMESRLFILVTCGFGVWTSLEALWVRGLNLTGPVGGHNWLSCPSSADTALKPYLTLPLSRSNEPLQIPLTRGFGKVKLILSRPLLALAMDAAVGGTPPLPSTFLLKDHYVTSFFNVACRWKTAHSSMRAKLGNNTSCAYIAAKRQL